MAPAPGLAVLAARLLVIVVAAPAFEVRIALALLQPGTRCDDGVKPVSATRNLRGDVQLGLVLLGLVSRTRLVEQCFDLRLQLGFGLGPMPVAHRLVAARVGLDLGAVHRDGAKLDQPPLACQAHDLHEQNGWLRGPSLSQRARKAPRSSPSTASLVKCAKCLSGNHS